MRDKATAKCGETSISYRIATIPRFIGHATKNSQPLALAYKFRDFRLFALETSPGAFASTYDDEARRGIDHTLERLENAKATQFLALSVESTAVVTAVREANLGDLLEADWLGIVVLMGPQEDSRGVSATANPFGQMTASNNQTEKFKDDRVLHFHLNAMFVHPSARRSGVGGRLVEAALERAKSECARSSRGMHCTIIVDEWNTSARNLYACCGFDVVAREIYGDDRVALRMELWAKERKYEGETPLELTCEASASVTQGE